MKYKDLTKKEHITIHIKDALRHLNINDKAQVEFDLFEIADILNISVNDIDNA